MGKKLRKPLHLETEAPPAAKQPQQVLQSVTPRPCTASKPLKTLPGGYTSAVRQLQIQVPPLDGDLQAEVTLNLAPLENLPLPFFTL